MTLDEDKGNRTNPSVMTTIEEEDATIMGIAGTDTTVSPGATEATTIAATAIQTEVDTTEVIIISSHVPRRQTMEGEMMPQDNSQIILRQVVLKTTRVLRTVQLKRQ